MANGPVRHTKQKDAVMAQLRGCDDFISAQELHRKLVDSGLRIGLATVCRQLNALVDSGAADTVRMDGQQLFRLCGDDAHHARGADDQGCSAKAPFADALHGLDHGRAAHGDGKQRVRRGERRFANAVLQDGPVVGREAVEQHV